MSGMIKKVIYWVVGVLVLFGILVGTIPDIIVSSGNLTNDVEGLPPIIATVASFWWVGVLLLLVGVIMSTRAGRSFKRRLRRRR